MRIYLQASDYEIWEVVCNGPFMPLTKNEEGDDIPKPSNQWSELKRKKNVFKLQGNECSAMCS